MRYNQTKSQSIITTLQRQLDEALLDKNVAETESRRIKAEMDMLTARVSPDNAFVPFCPVISPMMLLVPVGSTSYCCPTPTVNTGPGVTPLPYNQKMTYTLQVAPTRLAKLGCFECGDSNHFKRACPRRNTTGAVQVNTSPNKPTFQARSSMGDGMRPIRRA